MSIMDNKKVDLVFIIDSSLSMKDEAEALCAKLESAIEEARKACPSDLRTDFLGIEGVFAGTKFNKTVRQFLTSEAGANPSALKGREYVKEGNPAQEDVAPAAKDVIRHYNWRDGAEKNVFVLGDESLKGGEMTLDAGRIKACDDAIATALEYGVKIHSYLGTPHVSLPYPTPDDEKAMVREYKRLALRTGGEHYIYTSGIADFASVLKSTICASKATQHDSVANKKEEADALEGKTPAKTPGNGSDLCAQAPEIVRAVNTLADVLKNLIDACASDCRCKEKTPPCPCQEHHNKPVPPSSPPAAPDTSPVSPEPPATPFLDESKFTNNHLNHWQFGPATPEHEFYSEGGATMIRFPTTNAKGRTHNGVLLYKHYSELLPGKRYRFSLQARRDNDYKVIPELSLRVAGQDITSVTALAVKGEWVTLSGEFTAAQGDNVLEIFSHKASGDGNDFSITGITVKSVD
ncbi:carbohydrate binding domain-containing protein [Enterobacter ludwigii]|uniref:carbohydrate binding domain-containing protein n=1 Tax=Enterobacter ludwigii TaxID=299767 RepID=UPI001E43A76C|nr:carbohydrate binding domain-containing protein [Enterobacter ludwigii]MCE1981973.1 carbohydrate binding domain-containing protein [Enterobacter ludwigii]